MEDCTVEEDNKHEMVNMAFEMEMVDIQKHTLEFVQEKGMH